MKNPFVVDRPVTGDELCGRDPALERLLEAARRSEPAAAIAPRGGGASSVARELARRLTAEGRTTVLVEAADRTHAAGLLDEALRTVEEGPSRPNGGRASVGGGRGGEPDRAVADRVRQLAAGKGEHGLHLVLDGLGRRGEVEGLDALGRAAPAEGVGVTALWQGSPGGDGGPLAPADPEGEGDGGGSDHPPRDAATLGPVPLAAWLPYALERFLRTDRWIANEHVRRAVEATGGRPLHTQLLLHLIWTEAGPEGGVDGAVLERAEGRLLVRSGRRFRLLLDPLTRNQRSLLEALALSRGPVRPYASDFVRRHGFASPSSVQRALNALRDLGLVEDAGGEGPRPADPLLVRWLRRRRAERSEAPGERKA